MIVTLTKKYTCKIVQGCGDLASVFFSEGNYHHALKYYNKSLDITTKHLWRNDPNVATIWHNIGDVHRAILRSNLAIICFERALAIRREYFYESDVSVVRLVCIDKKKGMCALTLGNIRREQ